MINRVTENMKFSTITGSLFKVQGQSANLMEKLSTQKNINRPSDDPTGASNVLNYTSALASIEQYQTNITNTKTWLSVTDTNFTSIGKIITQAEGIAASPSEETMDSNVAVISSLIDDALSLMNAKQGDSYLFGGSRTDVAPFSATPLGSVGDVKATPVNNFDGTVASGGTYTGTVNKTYAVKIIDGGTAANLSDATYQVSVNGGTTWSATQTNLSGPINFGDGLGVTLTFTPGTGAHTLSANDSFRVEAIAATIGNTTAAPANTFSGTAVSGGTYTGTADKTYLVEIVDGGTPETLANATYHISTDGGATFGSTQSLSAQVVKGSVANTTDGTIPVTAGTHWEDIFDTGAGVQDNDSFTIMGKTHDGTIVSDSYSITNAATGTVQDLLDKIQTAFGGTVTATIDTDGKITLTDTRAGDSQLEMTLVANNELGAALDFGAINPSPSTTTTTSIIDLGNGINMTIGDTGASHLTDGDSFTVNANSSRIGSSTPIPVNNFDGTIQASGTYTGTTNKTYALKIISGGTLAGATYQISADGGITWGSTQTGLSAQTTLGDGIKMTFTAGTNNLAAGDSFTVKAIATSIDAAFAATANTFNGTVVSGGTYAGIENKTYAVKIITGGTLAAATYKMSADGGKTWGAEQTLPPQTIKGGRANTAGGSPITAATVWNTITGANVQDGTTIAISGNKHNGTAVAGTYTIANAATGTVQDLLDKISTTLGGTAAIDEDGTITVTDGATGESQLAMTITATNPVNALDFGTFLPAASTAITLGDGVNMTLNDSGSNNLTANDLFTVNAYSAGYYHGNDDQLTVQVGKNNNFVYNINGASAFTAAAGPVAVASVVGAGAGLTANDTITLTRGDSAGSWTLTSNAQYPDMVITSTSATTVAIDADNDGTNDVTLDLSGKWNANNTASFTITAGASPQVSAVTIHGPGTVDLLKTLNTLKTALEAHDVTAVSAQIDDLKNIQTQVLQKQTEAGAKASSLNLANTNHTAFTEQLTSMKSGIENADLAKLITSFQMQQIALQASYNLAAQIGKMTILNYL